MPIMQSQAKIIIQQLIEKYNAISEEDRKATTEANVVHQFIVPLFESLGWPTQDPARYKYELSTQAGRPDMTFFPERGGVIFTEAKRFGAIKELAQARKTISGIITPGQLSLPGMATDRSPQEQQAINYAFKNGGIGFEAVIETSGGGGSQDDHFAVEKGFLQLCAGVVGELGAKAAKEAGDVGHEQDAALG